MDLSVGIFRNDAADPAEVRGVHADDAVEAGVIGPGDLAGGLASVEGYAVLREATLRRGIDGVADFFRRYGGRLDIVLIFKAAGLYQRFKDKLCHGASAYIAVANEKHFNAFFHKIGYNLRRNLTFIRKNAVRYIFFHPETQNDRKT